MYKQMQLAHCLGLRPLDRLQINSQKEISGSCAYKAPDAPRDELPYWFFQRIRIDGQIEVSTPGGYITSIDPVDICDVIPSEPIIIQSMTRERFKERLSLPYTERQKLASETDFVDAYVLLAEKDRFGFVEFLVWFVDDQHNTEDRPWRAIQPPNKRAEWKALASRRQMPVRSKSAANYSADSRLEEARQYHRAAMRKFVQLALARKKSSVEKIQLIDFQPLTTRQINLL